MAAARLASGSLAAGAAILLTLVNAGCFAGRVQPTTVKALGDDDLEQLRRCQGILITGIESCQIFQPDHDPWNLPPGQNPGKKIEIRDPLCPQPANQPAVDDPDLTIEVSDYQEEYGNGIHVGPGFSGSPNVSISVRVSVTHKVLGVLYQARFEARAPLGLFVSRETSSMATLARRIRASPVGRILKTALEPAS
jgi:hypothetical protein